VPQGSVRDVQHSVTGVVQAPCEVHIGRPYAKALIEAAERIECRTAEAEVERWALDEISGIPGTINPSDVDGREPSPHPTCPK